MDFKNCNENCECPTIRIDLRITCVSYENCTIITTTTSVPFTTQTTTTTEKPLEKSYTLEIMLFVIFGLICLVIVFVALFKKCKKNSVINPEEYILMSDINLID